MPKPKRRIQGSRLRYQIIRDICLWYIQQTQVERTSHAGKACPSSGSDANSAAQQLRIPLVLATTASVLPMCLSSVGAEQRGCLRQLMQTTLNFWGVRGLVFY